MTAGSICFLRKVHARASCDGCSACAKRKNKLGLGGVPDGREESKRKHDVLPLRLHSDETLGN